MKNIENEKFYGKLFNMVYPQRSSLSRSYLSLKNFIHTIISYGTSDGHITFKYPKFYYENEPIVELFQYVDNIILKVMGGIVLPVYISINDIEANGKRPYTFLSTLFDYIIKDLYDELTDCELCWCYMMGIY